MLDTKFELRKVDVKIKCLIDEIDMDIDFTKNRLEMREKDLKEAEKEYEQEKVNKGTKFLSKIRYESLVDESNEKIKELEGYKEKLTAIKDDLEKITYINTSKIDSKTIGSSKTVDLVIPKDVTSDEKSVVIKSKDQ